MIALRRFFGKSFPSFIVSLIILGSICPLYGQAAEGQENPETAATVFSSVALFNYYSVSLDSVLRNNPVEAERAFSIMPLANIPVSINQSAQNFSRSAIDVSWVVLSVTENLSMAQAFLQQYRFDDVIRLEDDISALISEGTGYLDTMQRNIVAEGVILKIPSAPGNSGLKQSYDEVLEKIDKIREMFVQDIDIITTLSQSASSKLLKPTAVTLKIDASSAFVGDVINFEGKLVSGNSYLSWREIDILVDGSANLTVRTGSNGFFKGSLTVPYRYQPEMDLQAFYRPRDYDVGLYLASLSPVVKVKVLFYQAGLTVKVAEKAYPGLDTAIAGKFDYGPSPVVERNTEIYLDDVFVAEAQVRDILNLKILIPPETLVGRHVVTVSARPDGRYAPVVESTGLNIIRASPVLEADIPPFIIIPGNARLAGKLHSEFGPVGGASVNIALRGSRAELVTSPDGTFRAVIPEGLGLDLIGGQDLVVMVSPQEPWNAPVKITRRVLMVNLVTCIGFLLIVVLLGIYLPARLKARFALTAKIKEEPVRPVPAYTAPNYTQQPVVPSEITYESLSGREPRSTILYFYRLMLELVMKVTRTLTRPNQTLREYAHDSIRTLGPAGVPFIKLTQTAEKLLYSKYEPTREDAEKSRELSADMEKVLKK
jgi:hypothetical protein